MNRFLARISAQKLANVGISSPNEKPKRVLEGHEYESPCASQANDDPLTPQEIKYYLEKLDEKNKTMPELNSIIFDCIQNFVGWYSQRREQFNEKQKTALDSLSTVKDQINLGCSCKIHVRQKMADEYYKNFFINNQKTDIIPAIKLASGVEAVIFKIGIEEFLRA